jgi:hypothetical protein
MGATKWWSAGHHPVGQLPARSAERSALGRAHGTRARFPASRASWCVTPRTSIVGILRAQKMQPERGVA